MTPYMNISATDSKG